MGQLTHGLPAVPPMEPEVRERILENVLGRMDAPVPVHRRRSTPLLAAAAVLLVTIAVTIATTLPGTPPDPRPAVGDTATGQDQDPPPVNLVPVEPLPADQLPPPTGDPETDAALARCATAVVRSGHAAEYPPTTAWRNAQVEPSEVGYLDRLLTVDDAFGCLLTPESVFLSGVTGTAVGGLQLVRMPLGMVFVLNPERLWFTLGDQQRIGYPVMVVPLGAENPDGLRLTVRERGDLPGSEPGGPGDNSVRWSGPVPELVQGLAVVDRMLPRRTDTLDDTELANCLANRPALTVAAGNELWTPAGRHDVGDAAPTALAARIGDTAAGICVVDPVVGPVFAGDRLPAKVDPGTVVVALRTEAAAGVVLTAPGEELTRVEIAPAADPAGSQACTILDGLVVCTLKIDRPADGLIGNDVVVTAYSAGSTQGTVLYPVN